MSNQSSSDRSTCSNRALDLARIWLATICALALIGCGATANRQHLAAIQRWQAQPIAHYRLVTDEVVNRYSCAQVVEVRDERIVSIISNNCQQPSLWTVSWLFRRAETADRAFDGCALSFPGVGCVCRDAVEAQVEYDPALGFPRSILIRQPGPRPGSAQATGSTSRAIWRCPIAPRHLAAQAGRCWCAICAHCLKGFAWQRAVLQFGRFGGT